MTDAGNAPGSLSCSGSPRGDPAWIPVGTQTKQILLRRLLLRVCWGGSEVVAGRPPWALHEVRRVLGAGSVPSAYRMPMGEWVGDEEVDDVG